MPRKAKLPPREIEICKRLAVFRRETQIPRSVFARTVGFIPETLANYESARAPIRWDAFWAIHSKFLINPRWLVTGEGSRLLPHPVSLDIFCGHHPNRDLMSDIWDNALKGWFDERDEIIRNLVFGPGGIVEKFAEVKSYLLDTKSRTLQSAVLFAEINARLDFFSYEMTEALKADGTFETLKMLSIYGNKEPLRAVKPPVPALKKQRSKSSP